MAGSPVVVVACDKFKGSLTAREVDEAVAAGILAADPRTEVRIVPIADGGDGTVAALAGAGFDLVPVTVAGPTLEPVAAHYAVRGDLAVVELADTCGLLRLPGGQLAPLTASSRGLGEAVLAALDGGARTVVIGLGGSASNDGGAGMLRALGARLLDTSGAEVAEGGAALQDLARIDLDGLDPRLQETEIVVACDVDNPLLGPRGAVATFSAQKGAGPEERAILEASLATYASLVSAVLDLPGLDLSAPEDAPGAGAAGGVGFAALAVLGGRVERGVDLLLDLVGFHEALHGADLVVTGEGSFDHQTLSGKAPMGVLQAARRRGIRAVVACGRTTLSPAEAEHAGAVAVHALTDLEPDPERCMTYAAELLSQLGGGVV
ncbi:glycerate kinase [Nocardioides luteus]|uniref:Glycerate kinase n=1 Tax=Nocardioides luteus TaxID=1844 RepID=A0A1J4N0W9_9ACTN|nr:glycerate kinase [Nocardioides luteus]OIJ24033.1 glycerate kinase [Nocardioides luteus]